MIKTNSIYCFRGDDLHRDDRTITDVDRSEESTCELFELLYCKACGGVITSGDQYIAINDSHEHTFFNPAGIVFELGCFRNASGCISVGEATAEFTWFAEYRWRFALCLSCNTHLGWLFEMSEHAFYGLILSRLRR